MTAPSILTPGLGRERRADHRRSARRLAGVFGAGFLVLIGTTWVVTRQWL